MSLMSMLPSVGAAVLTIASLLVIAPMLRPRKPTLPEGIKEGLRLVSGAATPGVSKAPRAQLHVAPKATLTGADRLLPMLETIVSEIDDGHRILRNVAIGAILRALSGQGAAAQQIDYVIIDRSGRVAALIDSHDHPQTRREALLRAGFDLIQPPADIDDATLRSLLELRSRLPVALRPLTPAAEPMPLPQAARA